MVLSNGNAVDGNLSILGSLEAVDSLADGGGVEAANLSLGITMNGETRLRTVDVRGEVTAV